MKFRYYLAASMASLATTIVAAPQVAAQQITSGVEGSVESTDGQAISNATVVVTDERTGVSRNVETSAEGRFNIGSLQPGGPYTITVTAPGFEGQSLPGQMISLQGNSSFAFSLSSATAGADVIIVDAARVSVTQLAVGPGLSFGTETLEAFPSITRDIRDIIRLDPRVSLDRANEVDRISCLGGNDRTNTFTVDGIVQADVFGLNGTPFAARNSLPIPFDVIRETSVEFAPFDVEYSDFTGCLVNVVTKSGTNDFHGSAFYTLRNSDLRGDSIAGDDYSVDPFEEKRWGATLSGPIIPDRLWFSAGYEETDLGSANDFGPAGGGFANEANYVTQEQFDRFAQIARDVYGQDVGGYPTTLPEASTRYFARLDAAITDNHRLEVSYQRLEETNVESDWGTQELTGYNSFEDEGTISNYYSARLYSDWSDKISTEIRVSRADVNDVQGPVGFGEAQSDNPTVRLSVGVEGPSQDGILSTGPGIFRSANALNTQTDQAKFQVNINAGDHQIKIGTEVNDLEAYNLFAVNATGTLYFRNLDDFEAGILSDGTRTGPTASQIVDGLASGAEINATPTGDINEAAATFNRRIWSIYLQDSFQWTDQLNVTAGIRLQDFSGSTPRENPNFLARYGFSNALSFNDLELLYLPRVSFTYELDNDGFFYNTSVTGGVGRFSGGDPVVYFSNAFSNNGYSTGFGSLPSCNTANDGTPVDVVVDGQFTGFPTCVSDAGSAQAAAGRADTQSTDPTFNVPSVYRANLGISTDFGTGNGGFFDGWHMNLDYIYSRFVDTLNFVDLSQTVNPDLGINGYTVDGRPIYRAIDPTVAGCNAELTYPGGTPPVWNNVTSACFNTSRDDEIQLTNGPAYSSHSFSAILQKRFDQGIFTTNGGINLSLGYAWTDSRNNRDVGSSTATSSYDVTAAFDRQNPAVSTSNYQTRHNFTLGANFREQFIEDYNTSFGFVFVARSGRPYSLTFDNGAVFNDSASGTDNALLYVPSGLNDANVSPLSDAAAVQSLIDYVAASGCDYTPGASIERNSCRQDWFYDLDLRFSQELPGPASFLGLTDDKIELFMDFDNFLNLIDDSWNVSRSRPSMVDVVDGGVDSAGRYIITGYAPDDQNFVGTTSSIWRIQIGARYEF